MNLYYLFFAFHHNLYYLCTFSSKSILVVLKSAPENRSACSVCGKAKGKGLMKEGIPGLGTVGSIPNSRIA